MRKDNVLTIGNLMLLMAAFIYLTGLRHHAIRPWSAIFVFASLYFIHKSRARAGTSVLIEASDPRTLTMPANRPGRSLWIISGALVPLLAVSYFFLQNDASHGYRQVWPVYLFAGAILLGVCFWSALVARLTQ